jgi:hypothetical protein
VYNIFAETIEVHIAIPRFVEAAIAGTPVPGTSPEQVVGRLHAHAARRSRAVAAMEPARDPELRRTIGDIRAMALLGHYYGHKIAGATALAFFRRTGDVERQRQAVESLTLAAAGWTRFTEHATTLYRNPVWTNRVGHVDWRELATEVARDVEIARQARHGETPP